MAERSAVNIPESKLNAVNELKGKFGNVQDFIFTNYRGLTVQQISELRAKLREKDAEYKVIKNNFARIAFKELDYPEVSEYLTGPTALALARGDSAPVAKILFEMSKELPLSVKGGIIGRRVYSQIQVEAFSRLPSKDVLLAQLMGTMNGVTQKLVRVLQAIADQKAAQ